MAAVRTYGDRVETLSREWAEMTARLASDIAVLERGQEAQRTALLGLTFAQRLRWLVTGRI